MEDAGEREGTGGGCGRQESRPGGREEGVEGHATITQNGEVEAKSTREGGNRMVWQIKRQPTYLLKKCYKNYLVW